MQIINSFFQFFPSPLITLDQIRLLKYDNVQSGRYKTNFDIGFKKLKILMKSRKILLYVEKVGEFLEKNNFLNEGKNNINLKIVYK